MNIFFGHAVRQMLQPLQQASSIVMFAILFVSRVIPYIYLTPHSISFASTLSKYSTASGLLMKTPIGYLPSHFSGMLFPFRASDSGFTKGVKKVTVSGRSTVSRKITGLSKGRTYYVKVRAYKTVNGVKVYGAYSEAKKVKL